MNKKWLYGRNVVVSGCSAGMGKAITDLLITKYGCNVMGIARNKATLDEMKSKYNGYFDYRRIDITSQTAWDDFANELEAMGFAVDVVINNAGMIQAFGQFSEMAMDDIHKVINTNFYSVLYSCKAFIPAVKKSKFGAIMNVSSASAILPVGGESVYSATKAGVWGLTECLAQELRGYGVAVSCVMPGPVKTDIYKAREGEQANKADSLVESIGITSEVAAKRIVKSLAKRKCRVLIDGVAKGMDLGMKVIPAGTCRITSKLMKSISGKVASFGAVYGDQVTNELEIKAKIKDAKKSAKEANVAKPAFKN